MADESTPSIPISSAPQQLDESNKGFRMMKMLGWTGGSLGIKGDGIEEPISVEVRVKRIGLGLSATENVSTQETREYFLEYLRKYMRDEMATHDLVFAKEFSKDERKMLHS